MVTATKKTAKEWQAEVEKAQAENAALRNEVKKLEEVQIMTEGENKTNNLTFLGGLWIGTAQDGSKYMSGNLGIGGKVFIFKRKNRPKPATDSNYNMYITSREEKKETDGGDFIDDDTADEIVE